MASDINNPYYNNVTSSNLTSNYINNFFYNRDSSIDSKYDYIDLVNYFDAEFYLATYPDIAGNECYSQYPLQHYIDYGKKEGRLASKDGVNPFLPIYGSSVSYSSRLNILETYDNTLKILPSSENNLNIKYNLKFLLNDRDVGNLLKTIEVAGGYKHLKFKDPSNIYKNIFGLVEDYSVNKNNQNLNEVDLIVNSYHASPIFNWRTSSLLNIDFDLVKYATNKSYKKYDFVFFDSTETSSNKIDNFWFARQDIENAPEKFDVSKWSKQFLYEPKLPFNIKNKFDFHQLNYKNSFIQNIKYKDNSNSIKSITIKFENIDDKQCLSMLFFLEKKCGYRRFIYNFPIFYKEKKVFICTNWSHVFKYQNNHDVEVTLTEDPNPSMKNLFIDDFTYSHIKNIESSLNGYFDGLLYKNGVLLEGFAEDGPSKGLFFTKGKLLSGYYQGTYYIGGKATTFEKSGMGIYDEKYYFLGKLATGVINNSYYENGILAAPPGLFTYNNKTYYNGYKISDSSYARFEGKFYKNASLFTGLSNYEYPEFPVYYMNGDFSIGDGFANNDESYYYINGFLSNVNKIVNDKYYTFGILNTEINVPSSVGVDSFGYYKNGVKIIYNNVPIVSSVVTEFNPNGIPYLYSNYMLPIISNGINYDRTFANNGTIRNTIIDFKYSYSTRTELEKIFHFENGIKSYGYKIYHGFLFLNGSYIPGTSDILSRTYNGIVYNTNDQPLTGFEYAMPTIDKVTGLITSVGLKKFNNKNYSGVFLGVLYIKGVAKVKNGIYSGNQYSAENATDLATPYYPAGYYHNGIFIKSNGYIYDVISLSYKYLKNGNYFTGIEFGKYFINGAISTSTAGLTFNEIKFYKSLPATYSPYRFGRTYSPLTTFNYTSLKTTGLYDNKYYLNGVLFTGIKDGVNYTDGIPEV